MREIPKAAASAGSNRAITLAKLTNAEIIKIAPAPINKPGPKRRKNETIAVKIYRLGTGGNYRAFIYSNLRRANILYPGA